MPLERVLSFRTLHGEAALDCIIGLIGAKRAGKTTAFNIIREILQVQEITLAAKLKDVCADVFNIPRDAFDSHALKERDLEDYAFLTAANLQKVYAAYDLKPDFNTFVRPHIGQVLQTPRKIAQYIGTEVLRAVSEDIHCDWAAKAITAPVGVVTDMRFPNELSYFSHHPGFVSIYIQNYGAEAEAAKDTHASEAYLKDLAKKAQVVIPNNGTKPEFEAAVRLYLGSFPVKFKKDSL